MYRRSTLLMFLVLIFFIAFSQKEANVWYYGHKAGLDFNSGTPIILTSEMRAQWNSASICDSSGKFLFATNGEEIYNSKMQVMQNGEGLLGFGASSGVTIIQKPGSKYIYYVFTLPRSHDPPGLVYSVVDMKLDNGLGAVIQKNVSLDAAWDACEKLAAVKHANNKDIWIVCRKHIEDLYAAFLVTSNGIEMNPVYSYAPDNIPLPGDRGTIDISYNKKYFLSTTKSAAYPTTTYARFEIHNFNAGSGEINYMYSFGIPEDDSLSYQPPIDVEFSPDSKFAYFNTLSHAIGDEYDTDNRIYQFDMSLIEDSAQFIESAILITGIGGSGLQLATDGKIYVGNSDALGSDIGPVSVIHEPWKRGTECNFELQVLDYPDGHGAWEYFPNILLDYLYRFEWEGHCSSEPFYFQSNFQPEPAFIEWHFSDPLSGSNVSNDINPVHTFSSGGEFEVSVYIEYPNGRIEETSRVVTVTKTPKPDLGPDILKCKEEEITLNAGDEEGFYSWSTGSFGQNANEITVSDTGIIWVRVENDDCIGYDTIYVGLFPKPEINEENLQLIPTACGGSVGKILGLEISGEEPLSYEWYDADDNIIGNDLDITGLGVGNYFLHILDGNGCTTISEAYTITDAGDIEINEVEKEDTHCNQAMGSITIHAESASTDELLYSIDNGNSWQNGDSVFINLPPGNYLVKVMDTTGCESVYENNPVVIENIEGPEVLSATSQPEVDYLSNGEIDISALGVGDLFYSIDNGNSFQTNNGQFNNLSAGEYTCIVKDDFGCDTNFVVEVDLVISQLIEAIAGDGYTCIGNAAVVPLKLNNFTDISKFNLKLSYDTAILNCDGYIQVHPLLENNIQVSIIPGTDEVIINWQGDLPVSLEENATMLELVFGAKKEGFSTIDWAALPGESVFYNETGDEINADYHFGSLRIYTRPEILIPDDRKVCDGEFLFMSPFISGGTGDLSYRWQGPNGFESTKDYVEFQNVDLSNAGIYTLTVTDTIDCVEQTQVSVTIFENPQVNFPPEDTIYEQQGFVLEAQSGYQSYVWNTGDTTNAITIDIEGLYSVLITSNKSCKSSDSVTVLFEQKQPTGFYLPNAFTPNGDGLNDEFKPVQKYDFVNTYHMQIYNRWGEKIFETSDINQGWDGTYQGKNSQQGSYVYKIIYTAWPDKDKQQVEMGVVTLVR